MMRKIIYSCLFLLLPVQAILAEEPSPLKLGDDLKKAELVLGDLLPCYKIVFQGLNEEDIKHLISKETSRCLGSKKYGVFIDITSHDKIHSIRINREYAESEITKPLYGILQTSDFKSIRALCGSPIKDDKSGGDYRTYVFLCLPLPRCSC